MAFKNSHILLSLFLCLSAMGASAQQSGKETHTHNLFNHLDLSLSAGTAGIGLDLAMPVTDYARVRAGATFMPRFSVPMTFNMMAYSGDPADLDMSTPEAVNKQKEKFNRLSELMYELTGFTVDREVKMNAKGTFCDFKLLVDIYPFQQNRKWFVTAGFHYGSSHAGHVENDITEMPSLMGIIMYNRYHDYFVNEDYLYEPFWGGNYIDPEVGDQLKAKFEKYGHVAAHMGDFKDGTPYLLVPDKDGMVKADMYVHRFKPYLGIGFSSQIDNRWSIGFDAGALFWGKPKIYTHEHYIDFDDQGNEITGDRIDLANDVENVTGKVGDYVGIAKVFHVYPSINFRITCKLF